MLATTLLRPGAGVGGLGAQAEAPRRLGPSRWLGVGVGAGGLRGRTALVGGAQLARLQYLKLAAFKGTRCFVRQSHASMGVATCGGLDLEAMAPSHRYYKYDPSKA